MDGVAPALVGADGATVSQPTPSPEPARAHTDHEALNGAHFYKMSGSGNDFVFFDVRATPGLTTMDTGRIAALCARGTGIGADGVVFLDQPAPGRVRILYRNSDGSRASLCGNATLCTAWLAVHLGAEAPGRPFLIHTDDGDLRAWVDLASRPSFEFRPVRSLLLAAPEIPQDATSALEGRVGYANTGVPHLVVQVDDVDAVDLAHRGALLRRHTAARPEGANVNFVSPAGDGRWRMRTFERGVEGETLACGTGAVACAAVLRAWSEAGDGVQLVTRSGRIQTVQLASDDHGPVLSGEGRLVFEGDLRNWRE